MNVINAKKSSGMSLIYTRCNVYIVCNYQEGHLMHQTEGDKICGNFFPLELGAPHVTEIVRKVL